jgi:hypothetical protein
LLRINDARFGVRDTKYASVEHEALFDEDAEDAE